METARKLTSLRRAEYERSQQAGSSKDNASKQRGKEEEPRDNRRQPKGKGSHAPPPVKAILAPCASSTVEKSRRSPAEEDKEKPRRSPAKGDKPPFLHTILACQVCARYCIPRMGRCSNGDRCKPRAAVLSDDMLKRLYTEEGLPIWKDTSQITDSDLAYLTALASRSF